MKVERVDYLILQDPTVDKSHRYEIMRYSLEEDSWIYRGFTYDDSEIEDYLDKKIIVGIYDTIIEF